MLITKILKKIIYKERADSSTYVEYLRKKGVKVGNNCRIFNPKNTTIDIQNPFMISFGNDVKITSGVVILSHDYSYSVSANLYKIVGGGGVGSITIGNNVFIGMNSIILKDTYIGDNVIIGAGSIVKGRIDSNSVYAGNPAKKLMTIEEYFKKNEKRMIDSCKKIYKNYYDRYQKIPDRNIFKEYCILYADNKTFTDLERKFLNRISSEFKVKSNYKRFQTYEEFLRFIEESIKNDGKE